MRLLGILSQDFVNSAGTGAYIDGAGLWLVVTDRGRQYELRDGAVPEYVGDAKTMTIELARRRALEMREERYLGTGRMPYRNPLKPEQLHRFVTAWVSASIASADDERIRAKVERSLADTQPNVPHDEVMARVAARLTAGSAA